MKVVTVEGRFPRGCVQVDEEEEPLAVSNDLARISHTLPAAAADAPAGTAFLAAAPAGSKRHTDRLLHGLTTKVCEKCGLILSRRGEDS